MSASAFKLFAIFIMLIDHIAAVLQLSGNQLISYTNLEIMRAIGRMALPIFAFFIVEGFKKTRNIKSYITRMHIFAIISQIPFILAFSYENYVDFGASTFFLYRYKSLIFIIPMILFYITYIGEKKIDFSTIVVAIARLITPISLKYKSYTLLIGENLNIFYELGASLILLTYINKIKDYKIINQFLIITSIILTFYYISTIANYNKAAMLLILALYLFDYGKVLKSLIIILWGYYLYSYGFIYFSFVVLVAIMLLLYNGKKGKSMKYLFYAFYPMHLIILVIMNLLGYI